MRLQDKVALITVILTRYSYAIVFVLAGSMHVMGALILWSLLTPQRERQSAPLVVAG